MEKKGCRSAIFLLYFLVLILLRISLFTILLKDEITNGTHEMLFILRFMKLTLEYLE